MGESALANSCTKDALGAPGANWEEDWITFLGLGPGFLRARIYTGRCYIFTRYDIAIQYFKELLNKNNEKLKLKPITTTKKK